MCDHALSRSSPWMILHRYYLGRKEARRTSGACAERSVCGAKGIEQRVVSNGDIEGENVDTVASGVLGIRRW